MNAWSPRYYRSLQAAAGFFCMLGCSILSLLLSTRLPATISQWQQLTWGKICMILILTDSWLFTFLSGFLFSGVGTYQSPEICSFAQLICGVIYAISKVLGSGFLAEKVYIVWSNGLRTPRLKSPVFRLCLLSQLGWAGIAAPVYIAQSTRILADGTCYYRFKGYA
ncbi:hypothetical protein PM082_018201 [Marasmius tenuissimus]|nr:hypothetical protein PM082_018201 [Marasmius tenuissimus]